MILRGKVVKDEGEGGDITDYEEHFNGEEKEEIDEKEKDCCHVTFLMEGQPASAFPPALTTSTDKGLGSPRLDQTC